MAAPVRADDVLALLRARGGRVTTARRAVVETLLAGDDHLTADDIAARVQQQHPDVHRSTVYRTLEALEDLQVLNHVHLGHGPSTYHLAASRHQHAVCEACGAVLELPGDVLDDVAAWLERTHGFALSAQHFALAGQCRSCRDVSAR
jgi:Fur family transcriptional regulator, ferric uptake regulator